LKAFLPRDEILPSATDAMEMKRDEGQASSDIGEPPPYGTPYPRTVNISHGFPVFVNVAHGVSRLNIGNKCRQFPV
jgi:hypothetical protein